MLNFSKQRKHVKTSGVATKRIVKGYITSKPIQRKENAKEIIKAIKMGKRKEGERKKEWAEPIEDGRLKFQEICA